MSSTVCIFIKRESLVLYFNNLCHVKNPRKLEKNQRKSFADLLCLQPLSKSYRRKSKLGHTAIEFFCSGRHMIETCPKLSCLTALIRFLLFKGLGSFKKSFKKCGNVEEYKAYRLIPPMSPLFNGWTIPLIHVGYLQFH